MKAKFIFSRIAIGFGLILGALSLEYVFAKGSTSASGPVAPTPANTQGIDAADQAMNTADANLTAKIRKQLVDSNMSQAAKNITIVSTDGHVTLSGKVNSSKEKRTIESAVAQLSGAKNYTSYLEINPSN